MTLRFRYALLQEKQDRLLRGVDRLLNSAGLPPTAAGASNLCTPELGFATSTLPVKPLPVGCAPAVTSDGSDGGNRYHDNCGWGGGGDAGTTGGMPRKKLGGTYSPRTVSLGLNGPEVPSTASSVSPVGLAGGSDDGGSNGCAGSGDIEGCILGNGTGGGGGGGGGKGGGGSAGGGFLEDMVDMAAIQDMMAIPFNLCKTPSEREQQMLQSTANGPQNPGNVARRAGPGPGGSQPNGGGGGKPRARGSQASSVGEAAAWQPSQPTSFSRGKEVASDSQKPKSIAYAAGSSAKPPPTPPPRPPGQQSVSATLGYPMTTPVASFHPDPGFEAAGSNVRSQDDVPGRLPSWPGPYRSWLESRASDEQPPRDQEDLAGPVATNGGGPHMH